MVVEETVEEVDCPDARNPINALTPVGGGGSSGGAICCVCIFCSPEMSTSLAGGGNPSLSLSLSVPLLPSTLNDTFSSSSSSDIPGGACFLVAFVVAVVVVVLFHFKSSELLKAFVSSCSFFPATFFGLIGSTALLSMSSYVVTSLLHSGKRLIM